MSHRDQLDIERSKREAAIERNHVDRDIRRARLAPPFGFEQRGGERGPIDRDPQSWPKINERAKMILMRMGQHDTQNISALLDEVADIGKNEVDAGKVLACK